MFLFGSIARKFRGGPVYIVYIFTIFLFKHIETGDWKSVTKKNLNTVSYNIIILSIIYLLTVVLQVASPILGRDESVSTQDKL